MRKHNSPGCPCCSCEATFTVHLRGCLSAQVIGGSVTIDGATVSVDGNSDAVFTLGPGTYTIHGAGPGYDDGSTTVTIGSECTPTSATLNLSPDSDHVCCGCCVNKIARKVLYLTDGNGTWPLTYDASCNWRGTATVAKSVGTVSWILCDDGGLPNLPCYQSRLTCESDDVTYAYLLTCVGGTWSLYASADTFIGVDASHGCSYTALDWDASCYRASDIPPPPGSHCPITGVGVGTGVTDAQIVSLTIDTPCAIEALSLHGALSSWTSPPSIGPPVTGDIYISA